MSRVGNISHLTLNDPQLPLDCGAASRRFSITMTRDRSAGRARMGMATISTSVGRTLLHKGECRIQDSQREQCKVIREVQGAARRRSRNYLRWRSRILGTVA
jgi:hypothetical protein